MDCHPDFHPVITSALSLGRDHRQAFKNDLLDFILSPICEVQLFFVDGAGRLFHLRQQPVWSRRNVIEVAVEKILTGLGDFAAGVGTKDNALAAPKDFVVSTVFLTESMTLYVGPQFFRDTEEVLGCVGLCGSNYWSAIERGTPSLQVFREVPVNVKDDDAIATDAGEDTNSLEVRVALDRESYIGRSELLFVAGL